MSGPNPFSGFRRLASELTRRRVVHAVAVYAVAAWVAIQVASITFEALFFPPEALTAVVFLAVLGFPITVALAWAFQLTDEGLRRSPTPARDGALSAGLRVTFAFLVVASTAGLGWLGWETWLQPRTEQAAGTAVASAPAPDSAAGAAAARAGPRELAPTTVAVLYFDDHTPGDSLSAFADAFTEHLIHRLTQVEGLDVVSRHGVKPYRDGTVPTDSIARRFGAGSIVEGSVTREGRDLVVTVQLIDGRTQTHLMSEVVRRPADEPFALQDALAREVSRLLRKRLGREVQLEAWRSGTGSAEAWRLVQQAERLREDALIQQREGEPGTAASLRSRADSLLARAASDDPDWNAPDVLRARVAADRLDPYAVRWGEREMRIVRRGLEFADDAVERAPSDAGARTVRGRLRFWLSLWSEDRARADSLLDAAEADLQRAVSEAPGSARAWYALSELLHEGRGDLGRARYAAERARDADAYLQLPARIQHQFFYTAVNEKAYDDAAHWCRTGQRRYPEQIEFRNCELALLATEGALPPDADRAWELAGQIRARSLPDNRTFYAALTLPKVAAVLARAGRPDSARAVLRRARRDTSAAASAPQVAYQAAHAHLLLGDEQRALDLLTEFLEQRPRYASALASDPWFEPLRERPRFRALVAR